MFTRVKLSTRLLMLIGVIQIVVVAMVYLLFDNSKRLTDSSDWIIHTQKALSKIANIEKRIVDLETGQRGYIITGKEEYLDPFNSSIAIIYQELESFSNLTADNPSQTREIEIVKDLLDQKIAELQETIELRRVEGFTAAQEVVNSDLGMRLMQQIMEHTAIIRNEELRLLEMRSLKPAEAKQKTNRSLIFMLSLNIILILFMSIVFLRSIRAPLKKIEKGTRNIAKGDLDYRIDNPSNDELGKLSKAFNEMLDELKESTTSIDNLLFEIEERKAIEEKLKETNLRLLHNEKTLLQSNAELEQFAYVASHDLQEPLKTINMFVNLSANEPALKANENLSQYCTFLTDAADRMSQKIQDLLEYSRIGKSRTLKRVDTSELVETVLQDLQKSILENGASIEVGELPVILGYKLELGLLFQNLITNALKFVPDGTKPDIKILCTETEIFWRFSIKDNGIGIENQHTIKIFDMFKRLHLDEDYEGTGIGLAQCMKIVRLHNGKIWVESEVGKGSTFFFVIPKKT